MIKTPRPYLSWSQLDLFERNPAEYAMRYIYGESITNPRMELGKKVAEMIEKGEEQTNKELEFYRIFLPEFPQKEYPVKAKLGDLELYGILDGWDPKRKVIGEYKTGAKWTRERADKHGQLSFYALLLYLRDKIKPEDIKIQLFWCPTIIDPEEGLKLTGDIELFETKRTMKDILEIATRAKKAWEGIKKLSEEEYKALGLL